MSRIGETLARSNACKIFLFYISKLLFKNAQNGKIHSGGPPSADTILRVFRNVNADKIEKVFIKWAHGIYEKVKIELDRTIVAIDGKTM